MNLTLNSPSKMGEEYILHLIQDGTFKPGDNLPPERELSEILGVTRTTLREVLQKLARSGFIAIRHGKPTQVLDPWTNASIPSIHQMNMLIPDAVPEWDSKLRDAHKELHTEFLRLALKNDPDSVAEYLQLPISPDLTPDDFCQYSHGFTQALAAASGNAVYRLMSNEFCAMYMDLAPQYFANLRNRQLTCRYYHELGRAISDREYSQAMLVSKRYLMEVKRAWSEGCS